MSFVLLCYCRDMEYPYPTAPSLGILTLGTYLESKSTRLAIEPLATSHFVAVRLFQA